VNELDRNLLTDETILFETSKHWFAPVRDSGLAVLIVLGALVLRWLSPSGEGILGTIGGWLDWIAVAAVVIAAVWIAYNVFVFVSAHFGVTNMRVLRYEGVIRRRSSETLLAMLTDVQLTEPALGRMLGYGDIRILTSSGAAGEDKFETVKNAGGFRTAIQEQKAASMRPATPAAVSPAAATPVAATPAAAPAGAAQPAAPPPAPPQTADDASATLARLAEMRDQGLITEADFEAKKADILGRM
jgi:uncharacterized membrane protein YdbT with pleckstrin-like domain